MLLLLRGGGSSVGGGGLLLVGGHSKPLTGTPIDPTHPRSRGLVIRWLIGEGSGSCINGSPQSQIRGTFNGTPRWAGGHHGGLVGAATGSTADYISGNPSKLPQGAARRTTSIWFRNNTLSGIQVVYGYGAEFLGQIFGLYTNGTSLTFWGFTDDNVVATVATHTWYNVVSVYDGANVSVYVNGRLALAPTAKTLNTGNVYCQVGLGNGLGWDGSWDDLCVWDRVLSPSEIAEIYAEPYAGFVDDFAYFVADAGGAAYTLAADAGSYALTGSAAGLRAARKIAAVTGSYALTGSAAGLKAARKLAAATGAYVLTGSAASLVYSGLAGDGTPIGLLLTLTRVAGGAAAYTLAADAGSYALTGSAAGLKAGRKIAAATGAYVLTGSVANLVYTPVAGSYILAADAGVYALTGSVAGLSVGRKIAAATGSYSLTGSVAGLKAARRLAAASGVYTLTGSAATLNASGVDPCASLPRAAEDVSDARPAAATSDPRTDCQ